MAKKQKFLLLKIKGAVLVEVERANTEEILDKWREDGAAEVVDAEIVEIGDEDNQYAVLQKAIDS